MISQSTQKHYDKIIADLSSAIERGGSVVCPVSLAEEVASRDLAHNSRTMYKSAVYSFLDRDPQEVIDFDAALERELPVKGKRKRRRSKVCVPESVTASVVDVLRGRSGSWKYADRTVSLIEGTRLLGLRPAEWNGVEIVGDDGEVVRVKNAKFAERVMEYGPFAGRLWARGNGEFRELILTTKNRGSLRAIVQAAIDGEKLLPWEVHQRSIRRTHGWAVADLLGRGEVSKHLAGALCLYAYRHSVSADAKQQLDLFSGEVAGLMGHRSAKTAVRSYARRRGGSGAGLKVMPSPESVDRVATKDPGIYDVVERSRESLAGPKV